MAAADAMTEGAWWRLVAGCGPRSIVELVTDELSRRGIKPGSQAGADLARAEASAARLLADLGICSS